MFNVSTADQMMSAVAFGNQHPNNQAFFQRQLERASQYTGHIGEQMLGHLQTLYNNHYGERALAVTRAALNQVVGLFRPDTIYELKTVDDFQIAGSKMQRFVMANPSIRSLFHAQKCDGYNDSYVDYDPGKIGSDHHDYQMVMNGVVQETDEGWKVEEWVHDERFPEDAQFITYDQFSVLNSWQRAEYFMSLMDRDITSKWNAKL